MDGRGVCVGFRCRCVGAKWVFSVESVVKEREERGSRVAHREPVGV